MDGSLASGLGAAAMLAGCPDSPFLGGRYRTAQVILGETAGTMGLPQPFNWRDYPVPSPVILPFVMTVRKASAASSLGLRPLSG
jgi:hypothetical protein